MKVIVPRLAATHPWAVKDGARRRPLLLLLGALLASASGDHEVGCIFSRNLCNPEIESCYNDMAFGRCVPMDGSLSDKDLYQYSLEPEELELLRLQLERLEFEGYKWPHYYTQCIMQILLDDLRYRTNNDVEDLCNHLKRLDDDNLNEDMIDREVIDNLANDENPMATVRFTPSQVNPHGEFADEFYYPPNMRQGTANDRRNVASFVDYGGGFRDELDSIGDPDKVYRRGSRSLNKNSMGPMVSSNYPEESYPIPPEYLESLQGSLNSMGSMYEPTDDLEFLSFKKPVTIDQALNEYMKSFSGKYKYPKTLDSADFLDEDIEDGKDNDSDEMIGKSIPESVIDTLGQQSGIYSEAGHMLPLQTDTIRPEEYDDLSMDPEMFWSRELAGFKRRERLDVKKPGPPFSTNNYAFKTQSPPPNEEGVSSDEVEEDGVLYLPQQVKKEIYNSKLSSSPRTLENVDLDHVYIVFDKRFNSWPEGERVVNMVESLIGLKRGELREIRVGMAEVTFKVGENSQNYNATDIVNKIREVKDELLKQLNIEVVRAGIGDKVKLPAILEVKAAAMEMSSSMFGALVAGGVAAVSAAAIVILVVARRHAKSRAKLAGLRTPDPEASKDYQELCRARMHAKQADKLSESPRPFDFGRLIESGRSESNRSSTSSWGDDPAVTNMDIATGHVVLSYMEEHLKNTEKLDQEWAALCVYEAEPCSTAIAEAEGNAECNRPGAALPYDHSRVVLNDLANLNNTDYINASTITDHDPRNPAYIATQGPLPATAADFWQLVWEQGSVVIVMLTRLTEEGQAMCHRYWPDEGSECYHIYEVHLVSEHIWCDDYLVRSFYLKNLRTGETRTVTQFHFLTWPNGGVPHSTKALLEFRRKVNKSYRGRSCPIIVHCSDGAGRTGTYCLIDMVLNRMSKGAKEIDIAATLEHIRDQRSGMVSNKQQYEFVLMAVAEEVHAILKSLPIVAEKQAPAAAAASNDKPTTSKSDK